MKASTHILRIGIYQHLYLAFQFHRDDFGRPDASLVDRKLISHTN